MATTWCLPASRSSGRTPVARPAKVRDHDDERTLARGARDPRHRLRQRHPGGAVRLVPVAEREQQADEPGPTLGRREDALGRAAEADEPHAVPADGRRVTDGQGDAERDVGLAPRRRAEAHRGGEVEDDPRDEHPLGEMDAHVRLGGAGGDVPVDQPDVVARDVRPDLGELRPAAEERRAVVSCEQSVHTARDRQLERLEQALGDRSRPRPVRCRLCAECPQDADHAAAGLPSSSLGCGTAAMTASSTSSALRSSASAW